MQRKSIRATVGATDVDIPIHTFLDGQVLTYASGAITTEVRVRVVGTPTALRLATWFNTETIQDSGVLLGNVVTSSSTPSANQVATFTGSGVAIQNATVAISGGSISSVAFINSIDPATWVVGPASAVTNNIAAFNGTTGKLIKDSGVLTANIVTSTSTPTANLAASFTGTGIAIKTNSVTINGGTIANVTFLNTIDPATWVVGPASAVSGNIATYNGTTGKLIQDGGVVAANLVTSASTPSANQVATFTGTGKAIQNATVTISGGAIASVTTINTIDPATWVVGPSSAVSANLAQFNGTTGKLISDSGLASARVVIGPASSTSGNIPSFSNTSGNTIQNTSIPSANIVVSSGSHVANNIVGWTASSGKDVYDTLINASAVCIRTITPVFQRVATWVGGSSTDSSLQQATVTMSGGAIASVTSINGESVTDFIISIGSGTNGNLASYAASGSATKRIQDTGIASSLVTAHAARHLPAGADSLFTNGTFASGDHPLFISGSPGSFSPRFIRAFVEASKSVSTTFVTWSGVSLSSARTANYAISYDLFVTFGDTSGNIECRVTWSSGTGVVTALWHQITSIGATSSGTTMSFASSATVSACCLRINLGLSAATASSTVTVEFRKSSGVGFTIADKGTTVIREAE